MSMPAAVQQKQSTLLEVVSGRLDGAQIYFLYGVEGIGKSTFARDAEATVIDVERGTRKLDLRRFKEPQDGWTWPLVLETLRQLATAQHHHKRIAVDTLDGLEALIWRHICERDGRENIEAYGYGKGYNAALDEWKLFVAAVEQLKVRREMDVILIAHAQVKTFKNPEGEDFDRYSPALHDKAAGLLKSRSDTVLFANHEQFAKKKNERDKMEKAKGVGTGRRLVYTTRTAAYDAKNRDDLPPSLEFSWVNVSAAISAAAAATPADLCKLIEEKVAQMRARGAVGETAATETRAAIKRAGEDTQKLRQLNNWAAAKLDELAAQP